MPWLLLGALFLAPFVDLRRPFRLLHLDLVVLAGFGVDAIRWVEGPADFSVAYAIVDLGLVYLFLRLLFLGIRPREPRRKLVPRMSAKWILVGLLIVVSIRVSYLILDERPIYDVGIASVIGADRIATGKDLYGGATWIGPPGRRVANPHYDTYGPATYIAYVPFEQMSPYRKGSQNPRAARAAAAAFDLLALLGFFLLGRRLGGREKNLFGLLLAYAWASYPYSFFVLWYSFNDSLVTLLLVGVLLSLTSPVGRGIVLGLAAATKFAPAAVAPLILSAESTSRVRRLVVSALTFAVVVAAVFAPFIPAGGLHEIYRRTVGLQNSRPSVWRHHSPNALQPAVLALSLLLAFFPRRKSFSQLCALGGAVIVAVELVMRWWLPSYAVWFAPFIFVAFFLPYDLGRQERLGSPVTA